MVEFLLKAFEVYYILCPLISSSVFSSMNVPQCLDSVQSKFFKILSKKIFLDKITESRNNRRANIMPGASANTDRKWKKSAVSGV